MKLEFIADREKLRAFQIRRRDMATYFYLPEAFLLEPFPLVDIEGLDGRGT